MICLTDLFVSPSGLTNTGVILFPFSLYCAWPLTLPIYFWACNTGTFLDVSSLLPRKATDVSETFTWELWNGNLDSGLANPPDGKGCAWDLCNRLCPNAD